MTVIASSSGLTGLVSQDLNAIYNDNNIDGSTVTGISLDVPNVEFDLDESDDTISSQEIYAWYMNELMTTDGIRTIYKSITPKSQYRYCIDPGVVDLKLDNKDLVNSLAITNGYFYSLDNTSVIASGSGNIEMIPNESYVANSAEIVSGLSSIESKVNIVDTNVDEILLDTDELQQNQGDWATATGFSTSAEIANLNDFDPSTEQVIVGINNDKDNYELANNSITSSVIANNALSNSAFTTGYYNSINSEVDSALSDYNAPTASEIWSFGTRGLTEEVDTSIASQNASKADISALALDSTVAKEATLVSKASQASVDLVPTNPLLTDDSRLDNLDATISSRSDFNNSTDEVITDSDSREGSKADVSLLGTHADLDVINNGVKKSSKLIPHNEDLP